MEMAFDSFLNETVQGHRKDKTMIMVTHYESELPGTITDRIFLKRNR